LAEVGADEARSAGDEEGGVLFKFKVVVTPYVEELGKYIVSTGTNSTFYLATFEGPTDISVNYSSVVLYPNNETYLTAYVTTDLALDKTACENLIAEVLVNGQPAEDVGTYINVSKVGEIPEGTHVQKIEFVVTHNSTLAINAKARVSITLKAGEKTASAHYTYLPQRINKFEIKNYVFGDDELVDVINPDKPGLLVIDIVPSIGYYDYLVVEDITGSEEITFMHIYEDGSRTPGMDEKTLDGKGIKINYGTSKYPDRIYILTMIDGNYTSQVHTIRVTAYTDDGIMLAGQTIKRIQAKMLPNFTVDFVKPNGENVALSQSNDTLAPYYVANGVDAEFKITTVNANCPVTFDLSISKTASEQLNVNDFVEVVLDHDNYYTLRFKNGYNAILTNRKLTITIATSQTWPNGNYDSKEKTLELTIADFVVHGVHLTRTQN
ncbi:MAG: hypothetical protein MJ152_04340, partial [Clostridia bacterium]|nr:hypothetical protein [Clostridia bacterium]